MLRIARYSQAEEAFGLLTLDERVKLQAPLTSAGYWPAVPDDDFSTHAQGLLMHAIAHSADVQDRLAVRC